MLLDVPYATADAALKIADVLLVHSVRIGGEALALSDAVPAASLTAQACEAMALATESLDRAVRLRDA
jgi:hypothetical protein